MWFSPTPAPPAPYGSGTVYALGGGNTNGKVTIPADPLVTATTLRWGNYDVVNDSARWEASEVPSGIAKYVNPVPANKTLPASFFLSAKPVWWPIGIAWPPIGPDVTGGVLAGLAGHAHQIPACNCYANVMMGPADGSGNPLSFNAFDCYGNNSSVNNVIPIINECFFEVRNGPSGSVLLTFNNPKKNAWIGVYSLSGRKVMTLKNIRTDKVELTPAYLARGIYALELNAGGKVLRQQICLTK
jgi:hypothetical protein